MKIVTVALKASTSLSVLSNNLELNDLFLLILQKHNELLRRLYKKYVEQESLCSTIEALEYSKQFVPRQKEKLLNKIISAYKYGSELLELYAQDGHTYQPMRLVILDEPYCTLSDNIPLEDYDNNEGEPFWMRPGYIIEKYGKNTYLEVNTMTPTSYEHTATYKNGQLIK